MRALAKLDLPLTAMFSTMGRTAARTLESKIVVDQMPVWFDNLLANIKAGDLAVHNPVKWDPSILAERSARRRLHGSAARRARPLDRDQGQEDRQLSGGRALDLECRSARRATASPAPTKRR